MKTAESILAKARANNEPVFVLRAQDKLAITALSVYMSLTQEAFQKKQLPKMQSQEIEHLLLDFQDWQEQNSEKIKFPD